MSTPSTIFSINADDQLLGTGDTGLWYSNSPYPDSIASETTVNYNTPLECVIDKPSLTF